MSEVVKHSPLWTEDDLASINSFDDLATAMAENNVTGVDVSDFGTGYAVLEDKGRLVGVEFAILDWRFSVGDFGDMVTCYVLTKSGEKWIVNDGSTGIREQMAAIQTRMGGRKAPIRCPKGLTVSEYTYEDAKGEKRPAKTYYLSFERAK
jgi:hypothetical protein